MDILNKILKEMKLLYKIKAYAGQKFVGYLTQPKSNDPALFKDHTEANKIVEKVNRESSYGVWFEVERVS
jgi:hypothetical protein